MYLYSKFIKLNSYFIFKKYLCSFKDIKEYILYLRKATGAPFSICQEAAKKTNDKSEAIDFIKISLSQISLNLSGSCQNLSTGLVGVGFHSNTCALVKVNCRTDFVAKTSEFLGITAKILECFVSTNEYKEIEDFSFKKYDKNECHHVISEFHLIKQVQEVSGKLGENIEISNASVISYCDPYYPGIYAHSSDGIITLGVPFNNYFGRVGSIVLLKSKYGNEDDSKTKFVARQITGDNPFEENKEKDYDEALHNILQQNCLGEPDLNMNDFLLKNNLELVAFDREEQNS